MNASSRGYLLVPVLSLGFGFSVIGILALQAIVQSSQSLNAQSYKNIAHETALTGIKLAKQCLTDSRFGQVVNPIWPVSPTTLTSNLCNDTSGNSLKVVTDSSTTYADGLAPEYYSTFEVTTDNGALMTSLNGGVSGYVLHATGKVTVKSSVNGITVVVATDTVNAFVQVANDGSASRDVKQISINNNTTCAIATTRTATGADNTQWWPYCWGDNQFGQLGIGYLLDQPASRFSGSPIPKSVSQQPTVQATAITQSHPVCYGLTVDTGILSALSEALGRGKSGCIGFSDTKIDYAVPAANGGASATNDLYNTTTGKPRVVTDISVGVDHTCAIARDTANDAVSARAYCWGRNDYGQLGIDQGEYGDDTVGNSYTRNAADPMTLPTKVAETWSQYYPAQCVYADFFNPGNWWSGGRNDGLPNHGCWGRYVDDGWNLVSTDLKDKTIIDIVAGNGFTCAKYISGTDTTQLNTIPTPQDALDKSSNIQGQLACWGRNDHGQISTGDRTDRHHATNIMNRTTNTNSGLLEGGKTVKSLATIKDSSTARDHTTYVAATMCATDSTDTAYCWGQNDVCQAAYSCSSLPPYTNPSNYLGSYPWACGWGGDPWIQPNSDVLAARQVTVGKYRNITVGKNWTTAIRTDGTDSGRAYFWGGISISVCGALNANERQYHPNPPTKAVVGTDDTPPPSTRIGTNLLTGLTSGMPSRRFANTATSYPQSLPFCAIVQGSLMCINHIQPSASSAAESTAPLSVSNVYIAEGISVVGLDTSVGGGYSCGIITDEVGKGSVACWGKNTKGNLGNRTFEDSMKPIPVDVYVGYTGVGSDAQNSSLGVAARIIDKMVFF